MSSTAIEQSNVVEGNFADFLGGLFSLMARATPDELSIFSDVAKSINPELSDLISQIAKFKNSYLLGMTLPPQTGNGAHEKSSPPTTSKETNAFADEIDALFRDKRLFPRNENLISFLQANFKIPFTSKVYSRSTAIDRFLRYSNSMGALDKSELIRNLRSVRSVQAESSKDRSFFRSWSEVINNT